MYREYYLLSIEDRPLSEFHNLLRPSGPFGLSCGLAAASLVLANLSYLLRRFMPWQLIPGRMQAWMTSHVITGILALLLAILHSAMAPRHTVGGHALWALVFLIGTGAVGRYFYSFIPRAANGRELALEELQSRIALESANWDRHGKGFSTRTLEEIRSLVAQGKWSGGFFWRLANLLTAQSKARRCIARLLAEGRSEGLSNDQLANLHALARQAFHISLLSAHYEDLRALLASWRFFHRWVALLLVLLAALHVVTSLRYGRLLP
jgi:hypothetical protein